MATHNFDGPVQGQWPPRWRSGLAVDTRIIAAALVGELRRPAGVVADDSHSLMVGPDDITNVIHIEIPIDIDALTSALGERPHRPAMA